MTNQINTFTPRLPEQQWEVIADFVRDIVTEARPSTLFRSSQLLTPVASLVAWAHFVQGLPLERERIFHPKVVAQWADNAMADKAQSSRATYRSRMLKISQLLLDPPMRGHKLPPISSLAVRPPYSPAEIRVLRQWAQHQTSHYKCVQARMLLALGLGAGLSNAEIVAARAKDVTVDADGVVIAVGGKRARRVPVTWEWEEDIAEVAHAAMRKDMFLFRPRRQVDAPANLITNFVHTSASKTIPVQTARFRSTWLVNHLANGVPAQVILEAAGLDSLEALTRYVVFLPVVDPTAARASLRRGEVVVDGEGER